MWILLLILAATFAAFRFLYARSVGQADAAERLGESGAKACTRYRLASAAALATHAAAFLAMIGQPKLGGWVHSLPWGGPLWLVLGIVLMPAALYYLLAGLAAAGKRTFVADGSSSLFGGIYREMRHPQFLGLFLFLLSVALLASSPLLTAVSLAWFWQFHGLKGKEDADLERRLGTAYAKYRERTWAFIPLKTPQESRRLDHCLNCGEELIGPYCHRCGQRGTDANRSLRALAADYVKHELRRNPRFLRTLMPLIFKPGFLSREFVAGRRARYLSPLRAYLGSSILAFFLLALAGQRIAGGGLSGAATGKGPAAGQSGDAGTMEFLGRHVSDPDLLAKADRDPAARDSLVISVLRDEFGEAQANSWKKAQPGARDSLIAGLEIPIIRIGGVPLELGDSARAGGEAADSDGSESHFGRAVLRGWGKARRDPGRLAEAAVRRLPQAMFLLMPLFALFLKALYLRHRRYYLQHLVFALHFHSTAFLAVSIITALNLWAPAAAGYGNLLALAVPLHLLFGMKRFYGQGWPKTALKFILVSSAYMASSIVVLSLAFLLSLASL